MDQPTSSPESIGGSPPGASPGPAGQRQQGALGSRRVSEAPSQAPSIRDSREAGSVAGAIETQPHRRSPRATAGTSSSAVGFHGAGAGPHRPVRTHEAQGSAPDTDLAEHLPERVEPDPVSGFPELPWQSIVRRVELPPEGGSTSTAVVESRVVPGTAFGSCLERGYSWEPDAPLVEKILSGHVPHLALTRLTGATGETLFRGLHQGFIGVPGLRPATLWSLPHDDLRRLVSDLVIDQEPGKSPVAHSTRVEAHCRAINRSCVVAHWAAWTFKLKAGAAMFMESAAAALCSDPAKLQRAFEGAVKGKNVDIELFDISLLGDRDVRSWAQHYNDYRFSETPHQLTLNLRGPDREFHRVAAKGSVRQFAFSVADQGPDFTDYPGLNHCAVRLLGGMDSLDLGGDVRHRVEDLRARVRELGGEFVAAGHERVRTLPPGALEHRGGLQTRNRVAALQAEMARLDRQARALEQAGRQLKALWAEHDRWPTGADAYPAAARLALVAYLMGETPVFSCASGRDCNKRLDAEVKVLATVTDCRGGQVPPADLDTDIWDTARTAFRER